MTARKDCNHEWIIEKRPDGKTICLKCGLIKEEPPAQPRTVCNCRDCVERRNKEQDFLLDPFFTEVKKFCDEIELQQILKGAEKYPHPFNPDDWDNEQLANHAMSENRDQAVYITGMRDRMRKQAEQIETLKAEVEYWRLKAKTGSEYEKWKEVAEQNGICRRTFNDRVNKGLPYEMAATAPLSNTSPKKYRKDKQNENER